MQEKAKKRGRPAVITPWVDDLIAQYVVAEKHKPIENREQRKVLADIIQREIAHRKGPHDRAPKLSTIEKRITHYYQHDSPEDKTWTIFSLRESPIPPEALTTVLQEYRRVTLLAEQGGDKGAVPYLFTVRHAKWLARLSALRSPEISLVLYRILASAEQLSEMTGNLPEPGLLENTLAASAANDLEGQVAAMGRLAEWSTSEIAKLLGPQGENFMAQLKELEGKWARKREKGEK